MFGRFGAIFILLAVLLCTGILSANDALEMNFSPLSIAGLVIMLTSMIIAAVSDRIVARIIPENRAKAVLVLKLLAVILCAAGAIVVFCG